MDTQKALELLEKSEHIALLLPSQPDTDCLASAEVTARVLAAKGKTVGFLASSGSSHPTPVIFKTVLARPPMTKEFVVSLDTASSPISQLRYEKHEDRLDIVLSPKTSPIRQQSFSFRDGNLQCDCIMAFGISDIESMESHPEIEPRIFTEIPTINIDTSGENRLWAEANLVAPDKASLAEITHSLLSSFNHAPIGGETATLILGGIMAAHNSFEMSNIGADTMGAVSLLLSNGASWSEARDMAHVSQPLELTQLASRASVRSKEDASHNVLWSFLTNEDFEKTGRAASDLAFVFRHLSGLFPRHASRVLLWQDIGDKSVRATLQADAPVLEMISSREPGVFRSPHLELTRHFSSFQEAEERVASLLKEVI